MTIYFSPSNLGFYDDSLKVTYEAAGTWPSDLVAVTTAVHQSYIGAPPVGKLLGATSVGQPTWVNAPAPPAPTLAQQAQSALNAGLTITSASTPALDGTYSVDAPAQQRIVAEVTAILLNGTFADGATTLEWLDMHGAPHSFPSTAEFKVFASAVSAYVANLTKCMLGQASTLPAATADIA